MFPKHTQLQKRTLAIQVPTPILSGVMRPYPTPTPAPPACPTPGPANPEDEMMDEGDACSDADDNDDDCDDDDDEEALTAKDVADERIDDDIEDEEGVGEEEEEGVEEEEEEEEAAAVTIFKRAVVIEEVEREGGGAEVNAGEGTISGLIPKSTAVPVMPTKAESKKPALDRSIRYHRTGFTSDNVSETWRVDCQGSFRY